MERKISKVKHTPGPWKASEFSCGDRTEYGNEIVAPDGEWVAQLWNRCEENFKNYEANARLIAVSPELFDVCESLIECVDEHQSIEVLAAIETAKELIARARGKQ